MKIGFVILTHNNPDQLLRLTNLLGRMFDGPPIICHHDFGQARLDKDVFPQYVGFVDDFVDTSWAKWSVVEAALRAIRILYSNDEVPDWFFLLSGSDYPIKSADEIFKQVAALSVDALLDFREIPQMLPKRKVDDFRHGFDRSSYVGLAWKRYIAWELWLPWLRPGPRVGRITISLPVSSIFSPFRQDFKCFAGDHWFAGNVKVAEVLLNPSPDALNLQKFLRMRTSPDECYYQTVLCNSDLKLRADNRRFADWSQGGRHPKSLELSDLDNILNSADLFARKFEIGSTILDELDRIILSGNG